MTPDPWRQSRRVLGTHRCITEVLERSEFNIVALTVVVSVVLHGLTETSGSKWIAERWQDKSPVAA
jgi:hypothetical protein